MLNSDIFFAPGKFYSVTTARNEGQLDLAAAIFGEICDPLKPLMPKIHPDFFVR